MHDTTDVPSMIYSVALVALLGFAAWRDIATRRIPDAVSLMLIVVGSGTRLVQGWEPFGVSLLMAVVVFTLLLPFCSRGFIGGADLKLLAALAAGLSPLASFDLFATVTMVGGALALLYLAMNKLLVAWAPRMLPRGRASALLLRIVTIEFWRIQRHAPLPYGIAIAIGAAFSVLRHQGV